MFPRTLTWNDVTGVMNICDRHRGRSPCEYPEFCKLLSTLLCVYASGSAHSRSPPRLHAILRPVRAHRTWTTVPADYARLHRSGNSQGVHPIHLSSASTRQTGVSCQNSYGSSASRTIRTTPTHYFVVAHLDWQVLLFAFGSQLKSSRAIKMWEI